MRRLAQLILGTLALGMMLVAQPWGLEDCPPATCTYSSDASLQASIFWALIRLSIPGIIVVMVLIGVLGIRDSGRASDSAVYAALGQTQGTAVRTAARRGLVDGALVTGIAYVAAGILNLVLVLKTGYGLLDSGAQPELWLARAAMAVGFTAMLVTAHVVDAVRPRRTPVERLHEEAAAPRPRRISLAARTLVLGAIGAAATGVIVGTAVGHDIADGDAGTVAAIAAQGAIIAIWLTGIALFFAVGVPLLLIAMTPALGGAARLTGIARATHASAVLRARAATASGTSAPTVLAIAGLALIVGSLATADPAPSFAPNYVGVVQAQPAGVGDQLVAAFADTPGVGAMVVGTVEVTEPSPAHAESSFSLIGVRAADLAGVDDHLASLLAAHPGALVSSELYGDLSVGALAAAGIHVPGIVPTSTCCVSVVDGDEVPLTATGTALLIWAAPGADPTAVARTVNEMAPEFPGLVSYGASVVDTSSHTDLGGLLFIIVLSLVICGGPVVALAYGVVARRRREDATLAALGASRGSLTAAAVVETTVVAAVAVAGGLLSAAVLRMLNTAAGSANDSLTGVITDSYVQVMVRSVAWPTLAWMFVIAVVSFAVVAWIVRSLARGALPVEQLRAAEEGVLS